MRKYILLLAILVIGIVIGWIGREYHFRDKVEMMQADTVVRYDTIKYSKLELIGKNYRLDVPEVKRTEYVYIAEDSTRIIYRDSIRYVTMPREFYLTETDDAKIWHSGVDSRIDSLEVYRRTETVYQMIQSVTKRNGLSFGIELGYSSTFYIPLQIEYSYLVRPWLSVYGYAEYELVRRQIGAGIGTRVSFYW